MIDDFVPEMSVLQHQETICKQIRRCFNLSKKHPELVCHPLAFASLSREQKERFLDYDVETHCHKMFIFNYLIVLLGYKKNDKISIYNAPIEGKEQTGINFIEKHKKLIDKLYAIRDKVYSHFDIDFIEYTEPIEYSEIEKCINFLENYFSI